MNYTWLPIILDKEEFDLDQDCIDAAYAIFEKDIIQGKLEYGGKVIGTKPLPEYDGMFAGKNGTFRHLMTKGEDEKDRVVCWERVERVGWINPVLTIEPTKGVYIWSNKRPSSGDAIVLALSDFSYKIILVPRSNKDTGEEYYLLWAAYPILYKNQRKKVQREYEEYHGI